MFKYKDPVSNHVYHFEQQGEYVYIEYHENKSYSPISWLVWTHSFKDGKLILRKDQLPNEDTNYSYYISKQTVNYIEKILKLIAFK